MGAPKGQRTGTPKKALGIRLRPDTLDWLTDLAAKADDGRGRPVATHAAVLLERLHEQFLAKRRLGP